MIVIPLIACIGSVLYFDSLKTSHTFSKKKVLLKTTTSLMQCTPLEIVKVRFHSPFLFCVFDGFVFANFVFPVTPSLMFLPV